MRDLRKGNKEYLWQKFASGRKSSRVLSRPVFPATPMDFRVHGKCGKWTVAHSK